MALGIQHFILGLLANQPMSGYDVKRLFGRFRWLVGRSSFGNIYPALHALLDEGLVTVDVIARPSRPPRKVYHINERGLEALEDWNRQPAGSDASLKTFLMRLLLSSHLGREELIATLEQRRAEVVAQRSELRALTEKERDDDLGRGLALEYGLALGGKEIDWLEQTLEALAESALLQVELTGPARDWTTDRGTAWALESENGRSSVLGERNEAKQARD